MSYEKRFTLAYRFSTLFARSTSIDQALEALATGDVSTLADALDMIVNEVDSRDASEAYAREQCRPFAKLAQTSAQLPAPSAPPPEEPQEDVELEGYYAPDGQFYYIRLDGTVEVYNPATFDIANARIKDKKKGAQKSTDLPPPPSNETFTGPDGLVYVFAANGQLQLLDPQPTGANSKGSKGTSQASSTPPPPPEKTGLLVPRLRQPAPVMTPLHLQQAARAPRARGAPAPVLSAPKLSKTFAAVTPQALASGSTLGNAISGIHTATAASSQRVKSLTPKVTRAGQVMDKSREPIAVTSVSTPPPEETPLGSAGSASRTPSVAPASGTATSTKAALAALIMTPVQNLVVKPTTDVPPPPSPTSGDPGRRGKVFTPRGKSASQGLSATTTTPTGDNDAFQPTPSAPSSRPPSRPASLTPYSLSLLDERASNDFSSSLAMSTLTPYGASPKAKPLVPLSDEERALGATPKVAVAVPTKPSAATKVRFQGSAAGASTSAPVNVPSSTSRESDKKQTRRKAASDKAAVRTQGIFDDKIRVIHEDSPPVAARVYRPTFPLPPPPAEPASPYDDISAAAWSTCVDPMAPPPIIYSKSAYERTVILPPPPLPASDQQLDITVLDCQFYVGVPGAICFRFSFDADFEGVSVVTRGLTPTPKVRLTFNDIRQLFIDGSAVPSTLWVGLEKDGSQEIAGLARTFVTLAKACPTLSQSSLVSLVLSGPDAAGRTLPLATMQLELHRTAVSSAQNFILPPFDVPTPFRPPGINQWVSVNLTDLTLVESVFDTHRFLHPELAGVAFADTTITLVVTVGQRVYPAVSRPARLSLNLNKEFRMWLDGAFDDAATRLQITVAMYWHAAVKHQPSDLIAVWSSAQAREFDVALNKRPKPLPGKKIHAYSLQTKLPFSSPAELWQRAMVAPAAPASWVVECLAGPQLSSLVPACVGGALPPVAPTVLRVPADCMAPEENSMVAGRLVLQVAVTPHSLLINRSVKEAALAGASLRQRNQPILKPTDLKALQDRFGADKRRVFEAMAAACSPLSLPELFIQPTSLDHFTAAAKSK
jgi:hypothetical protein